MQHALTAPVFKSIALAGLVLGLGAAASSLSPERVTHRLKLHAVDEPGAFYMTVFRHGDIRVRFDGDAIHPITHRLYGRTPDGCRWRVTETLVPRDERSFDYDYDELLLGCEPGSERTYYATPRKGLVTVED